jgi:hypothetical protein
MDRERGVVENTCFSLDYAVSSFKEVSGTDISRYRNPREGG